MNLASADADKLSFTLQGNDIPRPESMLEANIRSTYFRLLNIAKDLYMGSMHEATKSGR